MILDSAAILVFLLISLGLGALDLSRRPAAGASTSERYGWLAMLAGLGHPLAWCLADAYRLAGDLTPFLAFDLVAASGIAAASATRTPGGKGFVPMVLLASAALAIVVQLMPARIGGVNAPLAAAVLLCTAYIGAAAECARQARLERVVRRPATQLALLCSAAAIVQIMVALVSATRQPGAPQADLLAAGGIAWLVLKVLMTSTLLRLSAARRAEAMDRVSRQLVMQANVSVNDLRVVTQAFYQLPGKALVTDAAGRILFANADARRLLAYPDTTGRTLEDLFIAVQPTGHQQVRALFERADHQAELVQIRMTGVDCDGQSYHLMQLEALPFDFAMLRALLVDSRDDAPHEATGLLDHHCAIAAMADGWFRLLDPVDRYAASGLFWDKLRILSNSDAEISHLENSLASASEARGWLRMRDGGGLSVTLHKLQTPDRQLFYRVELRLVDDAQQARAGAPCASPPEGRR